MFIYSSDCSESGRKRGRRKVEMKKMKNQRNLQVTFSKRRYGLFKKASELSTLCGAEILMILFSPGGKSWSFGHPNAKHLIDRFFNPNYNPFALHQQNHNMQLADIHEDRYIQDLNNKLEEERAKLEKVKHHKMVLETMRKSRKQSGNWFEKDVNELDLNETEKMMRELQDMRNKLVSEIAQHSQVNVSHNYFDENPGFGRNVDVGTDYLNQSTNTFNYYPNMELPNHTSFSGYNNDGSIVPSFNNDYMSSYKFNQF